MPHFIIAGAMKAGTSTMDALLSADPAVYIPHAEMSFFDFDDYFEHVDFFSDAAGRWFPRDFEVDQGMALDWYRAFFAAAAPGSLRGEQSTTYLASPKAASRIARLSPSTRIVIMLRDPASRAYSQHWHHVRSGRAHYDFEGTLRVMPERILTRSLYLEQVRRFIEAFPASQIHFVVFERFVADVPKGLAEARRFLGLPAASPKPPDPGAKHNAALVPRFPKLQLLRNRLLWPKDFGRYAEYLKDLPPGPMKSRAGIWARALDAAHSRINPLRPQSPPPMNPATRRFLNVLLRRANEGLDRLIGQDVDTLWYKDR